MGWTAGPNDLILGDPNGAHIVLLGDEAKVALINEFGVEIMVFDGTAVFEGNAFSAIQIRSTEGEDRVQIDQFQAALQGALGTRIRMTPGNSPGQNPTLEIEPQPITDGRLEEGFVRATSDDATTGGALILSAPYRPGHTTATVTLASQDTGDSARVLIDADLILQGRYVNPGTANFQLEGGAGSTALTTFADLPGAVALPFTKRFSSARTNLRVRLAGSASASVAGVLQWGVRVDMAATPGAGGNFNITRQKFDLAGVSLSKTGERDITGVAAGNRLIQAIWRSRAAGPTFAFGADDTLSLTVEEVPV